MSYQNTNGALFNPPKELLSEIKVDTGKAILFLFEDDDGIERKEWFPLSQCIEIHHEDPARIKVSHWIYAQKEASWLAHK